jgi:hypothetical protein
MKLSQILIEAGVTPDDLHPDCRFIVQHGDMLLCEYAEYPKLSIDIGCFTSCDLLDSKEWLPVFARPLASDWQTTLSREQFIADYEAHCAKRP